MKSKLKLSVVDYKEFDAIMKRSRESLYSERHKRRLIARNSIAFSNTINYDSDDEYSGDEELQVTDLLSLSSSSSSLDLASTLDSSDFGNIEEELESPINSEENSNQEDDAYLQNPYLESDSLDSEDQSCDSSCYRYSSSNSSDIELLSEDSSDDDYFKNLQEERNEKFKNELREICLESSVDHAFNKRLLECNNKYTETHFPKDPRTFLKTPRNTTIITMQNGSYYHFGLERALTKIILEANERKLVYTNNIILFVNIDAAPLHKSTTKGIWVIQCSCSLTKYSHPIGIFYGTEKPSNCDELLRRFVDELKNYINHGFHHCEQTFSVILSGIILDAPAKSMVLNVVGNSGYHSCPACTIVCDYEDRICFPTENDAQLRLSAW